ncbi:hypothetical protein M5D96_006819, partial [Drosophila gunungcola]
DANILAAPSHHIQSHIYDLPQQLQPHQHHQQQQQHHQHHQQQHQLNVEAVILQNQVDTLHWQLKQMYRAVMEEVARFFERYQLQQQLQQTHRNGEQIARSKSLHHVHGVGNTSLQSDPRDDDASSAGSASYLRARSSTNLILNKRRSPKKSGGGGGCKARLSSAEASEEKLNQEAFRLARTIRNLLHTSEQQPDLTQPASLAGLHFIAAFGKSSSSAREKPVRIMNATLEAPSPAAKSNAELIFLRANNMRDSRLSLRSSTDSSVHSTISSTASSSSKVETDEESQSNNNHNNTTTTASNAAISNTTSRAVPAPRMRVASVRLAPFTDVGLPLSSTLMNGNQRRPSMSSDSRNSTLKSGLNMREDASQDGQNHELIDEDLYEVQYKHPLEHVWTLWYLENDRTKHWKDMLNEVTQIDSVETFWRLYYTIKTPSQLKIGCDYSIPMWEDEANIKGGRWLVTVGKSGKLDLDRIWLDILLMMVGQTFDYSDEICGAVINIRAKSSKICASPKFISTK